MTDSPDTRTPVTEPDIPTPARRWKLAAGLAGLVALLAIGIAVFAVARDDNDDRATATEQIAAARQACRQWLDDAAPGNGPGAAWCDQMAGWMTDHMRNGPMMMSGSMMWDSPEAMRDWCVEAMSGGRAGVDDATQRCDQMVGWMNDHMGDWDNWHGYWGN